MHRARMIAWICFFAVLGTCAAREPMTAQDLWQHVQDAGAMAAKIERGELVPGDHLAEAVKNDDYQAFAELLDAMALHGKKELDRLLKAILADESVSGRMLSSLVYQSEVDDLEETKMLAEKLAFAAKDESDRIAILHGIAAGNPARGLELAKEIVGSGKATGDLKVYCELTAEEFERSPELTKQRSAKSLFSQILRALENKDVESIRELLELPEGDDREDAAKEQMNLLRDPSCMALLRMCAAPHDAVIWHRWRYYSFCILRAEFDGHAPVTLEIVLTGSYRVNVYGLRVIRPFARLADRSRKEPEQMFFGAMPEFNQDADHGEQPPLKVEGSLSSTEIARRDDVTVDVVISTSDARERHFDLGSFPQCFGVYIIGPWGPIQPDAEKVRPENWMHQQHSAARRVSITEDSPFKTSFKLSDYFPTADAAIFRPGKYQVNVKFFDIGLGLSTPIDSGPLTFTVKEGVSDQ